MGAGLFPAGLGGAGLNPVQLPSAAQTAAAPPQALLFDPGARGFVTNLDGSIAGVHPVDQSVALAMFFEEGSIPSSPTTGNRFRKLLSRSDPARQQTIVQTEALRCLARLIADKDIALLAAVAYPSAHGRTLVRLEYFNLRLSTGRPGASLSKTTLEGAVGAAP